MGKGAQGVGPDRPGEPGGKQRPEGQKPKVNIIGPAYGMFNMPSDLAEIRRLVGKVEQRGYTLVPLNLHFKNGWVKAEIALAKGKAEHDKRDTIKDREGKREVERAMKSRNR